MANAMIPVPNTPGSENLLDASDWMHRWASGLSEEVSYWRCRLRQAPEIFERRRLGAPPLQNTVEELQEWVAPPPHVLDIGSGPVSPLGVLTKSGAIRLMACDPLAPMYNELLSAYGIQPYVRTQQAFAECLIDTWQENTFDFVHARNCLDHCIDPLIAIQQCLAVTRIHGLIKLEHHENEASFTNYAGLHSWNFTIDNDSLLLKKRNENAINVTKVFSSVAEISCCRTLNILNPDRKNIVAVFRKISDLASPASPYSFAQLAELVDTARLSLTSEGKLNIWMPKYTVCVLGTGYLGRWFLWQVQKESVNVAAWIDDFSRKKFIGMTPVHTLRDFPDILFDYLVVAVNEPADLPQRIAAKGIPENKIIWLGPIFYSRNPVRHFEQTYAGLPQGIEIFDDMCGVVSLIRVFDIQRGIAAMSEAKKERPSGKPL